MKLIGKGMFTKCYLNDDGQTVTLKSDCWVKECMGMGWFPTSYLFPVVDHRVKVGEYAMRYYPEKAVKANLDPDQWDLYKALRGLRISYLKQNTINAGQAWREAFATLPDRFAAERESLSGAIDALGNYGENIGFEISPRNVRADKGKLVLLDCFYMPVQAERILKERASRRRRYCY